jgi:AcrR family transcriptional regulator
MYHTVQYLPMTVQAPGETTTPRGRLLEATVDYVAQHGVGELSLRHLAAAIGTSHRMFIYHFGSKDGLLVEVVREVERRQRDALVELDLDPDLTEAELFRRMWKRLADPAVWAHERLFFEMYGQALQGRGHSAQLLDDVVSSWVEPVAAKLVATRGLTRAVARADARLRLAVVRGLLLDLLATGDRAGANRAIELFIDRYAPPDGSAGRNR